MMQYKATVSFAGDVTMCAGEVREIADEKAAPLVACGYIVPVEKSTAAKKKSN